MSTVAKLRLKIIPKAAHEGLVGWIGDSLKIRVKAAPERGRANNAVIALLAATLGIPRERIALVAGAGKAHKVVEIRGVSEADLRLRLNVALRDTLHGS